MEQSVNCLLLVWQSSSLRLTRCPADCICWRHGVLHSVVKILCLHLCICQRTAFACRFCSCSCKSIACNLLYPLQAQDMSRAVRRLPRALSQWLPSTGQQQSSIGYLPTSRLAHILQRHFPPLQPAQHAKACGHLSYSCADSASGGHPQAAFRNGAGWNSCTQQQQLLPRQQKENGGRKAARAAGALLRERHEMVRPVGRVPHAKGRPQSAGSNAELPATGKPAVKGKTKPRARSVSPNSQYNFSCTSTVPDHGSSWIGDAASVVLQDWPNGRLSFSKGRAHAKWPSQMPSVHAENAPAPGPGPGPAHTTFVVTHQQGALASHHVPGGQEFPYRQRAQGRQQVGNGSCQQQEHHPALDGTHGTGDQQTDAAALKAPSGRIDVP